HATRIKVILTSTDSRQMIASGIWLYQIPNIQCHERGSKNRSSEAPFCSSGVSARCSTPILRRSIVYGQRRSFRRSEETVRVFLKTSCFDLLARRLPV